MALKNPFEPRTTPQKDLASVFSNLAYGNLHRDSSPKGSPRSARRLPLLPDGTSPHGSPRLPAPQQAFAGLIDLGADEVTPGAKPKPVHARRQLLDPASDEGDATTPPVDDDAAAPLESTSSLGSASVRASELAVPAAEPQAVHDLTSPDLEEGGWLFIP